MTGRHGAATDTQRCPVCGAPRAFRERYPRSLCAACVRRAVDERGRPLDFFNEDGGGGLTVVVRSTGERRESPLCWVDGVRCRAEEARMGGVVVQTCEG